MTFINDIFVISYWYHWNITVISLFSANFGNLKGANCSGNWNNSFQSNRNFKFFSVWIFLFSTRWAAVRPHLHGGPSPSNSEAESPDFFLKRYRKEKFWYQNGIESLKMPKIIVNGRKFYKMFIHNREIIEIYK